MIWKKGQAALEYLMTYGWAILIIIVVVAALYAMGVFTPRRTVPYKGLSYFAYVDHDSTSLVVTNGAQKIEYAGTEYESGATITITHGCASWPCDVSINYKVVASGLNHTDSVTLYEPT